jgi:hypothetical protein
MARPAKKRGAIVAPQDGLLFPEMREDALTEGSLGNGSTGGQTEGSPDAAQPWRQGWELTEDQRAFFRERSVTSAEAKRLALSGKGRAPLHPVNVPSLNPAHLMPPLPSRGLRALSLFSGGGGLDLGFNLAGYEHAASYDILPVAGETLLLNRPDWTVFADPVNGDVCVQDWTAYRDRIDVLTGDLRVNPSPARAAIGESDTRDMFPQFVRAVLGAARAFVAENVAAQRRPSSRDTFSRQCSSHSRNTTRSISSSCVPSGSACRRRGCGSSSWGSSRAGTSSDSKSPSRRTSLQPLRKHGPRNRTCSGLPRRLAARRDRASARWEFAKRSGSPISGGMTLPRHCGAASRTAGATSVNSSVALKA